MSKRVVILGGGLAGLSCAYEMAKAGLRVTVLEREPKVGGMASSFEEGDRATAGQPDSDYWCYDYGPHRFHTKEKELLGHVREILGDNQIWARRLSRIFMMGRFFNYPLSAKNIVTNMSPLAILLILVDYAWVRLLDVTRLRKYTDGNFAQWVERRFGKRLSQIFFVQYTEKTWGMSATRISSDWASQRITLLNLRDTILKTLFRPKNAPRTLVTDFVYPRLGGIGELARGYKRRIEELGGTVLTGAPAIKVHREGTNVVKIEYRKDGQRHFLTADEYVSTIPVTAMAKSVVPPAPAEVRQAIESLDYVAIVFIYLKVNKPTVCPDNWVYLPEKELTVHRISEFRNFSELSAPAGKTMICAEITCRVGDAIWKASPEKLREIAVGDLCRVGLLEPGEVLDTFTKRIPYAYPIYDLGYEPNLRVIMDFVHSLENIKSGGRQGLFRYNNMDQSIEMGRRMAAALAGRSGTVDHEAVATGDQLFETSRREAAEQSAAELPAAGAAAGLGPSGPNGVLARPESFVEVETCTLCGSRQRSERFREEPFRVVSCSSCGLVYVTPRLKPELLSEVYNQDYWQSHSPKERGYADYRKEAPLYIKTFEKRLGLIDRYAPEPGRALDVGCAAGYFLEVLRRRGWDVSGVELSPEIARHARQELGIEDIYVGDLRDSEHGEKSFDLITMWDLVEHVPEPLSLLRKAASLLADDGHLVIETQNVESRFARLLGARWQHYKHLEHLYHFSPATIRKLLDDAGLEIVENTPRFGGKHVSLGFIRERATRIHPLMKYALAPLAPFHRLNLYVNLRDEMVIVARKR
ncbi:MAG: FAD-dependent oxidoreductase [Planctomycetota bacterium]